MARQFFGQGARSCARDRDLAAAPIGFARSTRSRSTALFIASHRSVRRWMLSQKSGLLPKARARIGAVAAATLRRLLRSSLTCLR